MLVLTEADHLDVVHLNGFTRGRDVSRRGFQNALVSASECAFFNGEIARQLHLVDRNLAVGEGVEPAFVECGAGWLSTAAHSRRSELHIIGHELCEDRKSTRLNS